MPFKESFIMLLPFVSAFCWAGIYTMNEEAYKTVNIPTNMMAFNLVGILFTFLFAYILKEPIDMKAYFGHSKTLFLWAIPCVGMIGGLALQLSIRELNPTYTGAIETSYILFIPLFAYLFFGQKQWTQSTILGGILILIGVFIIMRDKAQSLPPSTGV